MKQFIRWALPLAVAGAVAQWNAIAFAQFFGGFREHHATLAIKSDGSSRLTNDYVLSRVQAEQQVRMMERIEKMTEGDTADETKPVTETKPFTDEELAQKFRGMIEAQDEDTGDNAGENATVQVTKDTVRVSTSRDFASLEEMLKRANTIWNAAGLAFENTRFEITNNQLRVTLSPNSAMMRYAKRMRQEWKLAGTQSEFRLILPGKILSSGFPETKDNTTGILTDGKKDESLDVAMKLFDAPTVVTAESGGLKVEQPLESKRLRRTARRGGGEAGEDLPTTDAGPGFVAEAMSVTTTTLHLFPEGEKYFKESGRGSLQSTGAVVRARLFAPKGRTLQSVTGVRVIKATDDKGRVIAPGDDGEGSGTSYAYSSGSQEANSTQIQLHLELPQSDAQAIDELAAEAIAVSAGAWKEMTLTNLQENATNEIDLAGVLPGAKLIVTKFSLTNSQVRVQADLKGPNTIRRLDVQARIPGREQFNSSSFERSFRTQAGQSRRSITIQGYSFADRTSDAPVVIVIRYPEDLRRERVNFKLKGLDLL